MKMVFTVQVISQQPPGGRCTLYAGYAQVLARWLDTRVELVFSATRDAHGTGYPCLRLEDQPVPPADGVILMPGDILAALAAQGVDEDALTGLAEALEEPLERMLEEAG